MTTTTATECRIYVACLAAYNSGRLHGRWIDCDGKDADEIQAEVQAMLAKSPVADAEEWAIHDTDGFGRMVGEYTSFEDVAAIAEALTGDHALGFRFLMETGICNDAADAAAQAEEVQWTTERPAEAVQSIYEECHSEEMDKLPEALRYHIDWEGVARDWQMAGDLVEFDDPEEGRVTITNGNSF
ncbi:MAG: antirestriction protein ArdA [Verrucomicrobia bacterium]|nr:MAG: antirestriction protein ArdA [Verrucomicrobiota bacterium]